MVVHLRVQGHTHRYHRSLEVSRPITVMSVGSDHQTIFILVVLMNSAAEYVSPYPPLPQTSTQSAVPPIIATASARLDAAQTSSNIATSSSEDTSENVRDMHFLSCHSKGPDTLLSEIYQAEGHSRPYVGSPICLIYTTPGLSIIITLVLL